MLSKEQKVQECDATDDDSSSGAGLIMRRPDCLGISLRSTTGDDPSTSFGQQMQPGK
ncbi:MAG: hypothetical protein WDN26_01405 [Chitinophagaceae bacterium]